MIPTANKFASACVVSLCLIIGALTLHSSAQAQTIQLGNSDRDVLGVLETNGYTDGVITQRGFTIIRAEACKGGTKYLVKVSILKQIQSRTPIGKCGPRFNAEEAVRKMREAGYRQINARQRGKQVVALGCLKGRKFELTYNLRGDLINRSREGRCGNAAGGTEQLTRILERQGYDRVRFVDRNPKNYVVEACNKRAKVRLEMNRRGDIRTERRIGRCASSVDPKNLVAVLQQQGYTQIESVQTRRAPYLMRGCKGGARIQLIIGQYGDVQSRSSIGKCRRRIKPDDLAGILAESGYDRVKVMRGNRFPYLVEACKSTALVELTVSQFGQINDAKRVGRCAAPFSKQDLMAKLADQGYFNAEVEDRPGGGYVVKACQQVQQVRFRVSPNGDFRQVRPIGVCRSETVNDVLSTLEQRGAEGVRIYVEGCFRQTPYRWEFDRLGNRTGRERLSGGCR